MQDMLIDFKKTTIIQKYLDRIYFREISPVFMKWKVLSKAFKMRNRNENLEDNESNNLKLLVKKLERFQLILLSFYYRQKYTISKA